MSADLLVIMSDVNGLYTNPPDIDSSRMVRTFSPKSDLQSVVFKGKSRVGLGGMESKVSMQHQTKLFSPSYCIRILT